jgi:hypothetical protein
VKIVEWIDACATDAVTTEAVSVSPLVMHDVGVSQADHAGRRMP